MWAPQVLAFETNTPDKLEIRRRRRRALASDFRVAVAPWAVAIVDALLGVGSLPAGAAVVPRAPGAPLLVIHEGASGCVATSLTPVGAPPPPPTPPVRTPPRQSQ